MGLVRLVYSSSLNPPDDFLGKEDELVESIRARAEKKNKERQVSGVLLYNKQSKEVIQVLEGQKDTVLSLFHDVIAKDDRHKQVTIQVEKEVVDRDYKEWGMLAGGAKDWKAVKLTLPASVEGKKVASFDEAFAQKIDMENSRNAANTKASGKKKKKGLFACFG